MLRSLFEHVVKVGEIIMFLQASLRVGILHKLELNCKILLIYSKF